MEVQGCSSFPWWSKQVPRHAPYYRGNADYITMAWLKDGLLNCSLDSTEAALKLDVGSESLSAS